MKPSRLFPVLLALVIFSGCSRESAPALAELPVAKVQTLAVHVREVPVMTELSGSVRPVQHAMIAAKLMGVIEALPIALGQAVKEGDVLVRISAAEIEARVSQAKVGVAQAKREAARERELLGKGAATADLVKNLEERVEATQALLREAEAMRDYTTVRAPFAGVVARKFVLAGDLASPGQALLEIEGDKDFEVELGLPESLRGIQPVGALLRVTVPKSGQQFGAVVREISSAADAQVRTITLKLSVPAEAKVYSGEYVRVSAVSSTARVVLVPVSSISLLGQMERVFIVHEGRARLKLVRTGEVHGDYTEVSSGLSDGDLIVVAPSLNLRDGQLVEVQKLARR